MSEKGIFTTRRDQAITEIKNTSERITNIRQLYFFIISLVLDLLNWLFTTICVDFVM